MRTRSHLPFVGLLALAATVAMFAGVGTVDQRERGSGSGDPANEATINVAVPTANVIENVALATAATPTSAAAARSHPNPPR